MKANEEIDKICTTLDKLTLDTLTLMEEHIQLKINLENSMNDGILNLAKSRYILGQNSVSSLQLPTVDSQEVDATAVIHAEEDEKLGYRTHSIEIARKSENNSQIQDPLKWFGVLVPQSLHTAQNRFRQVLNWITQIGNVQSRLDYSCKKLAELKHIKNKILEIK